MYMAMYMQFFAAHVMNVRTLMELYISSIYDDTSSGQDGNVVTDYDAL